ncbi:MAG: acyl-ACP--UDP-N-acetylglucosamine O-acyltransferase [Candidatus Cloacimonetes bacterium]|nr:acyl-ACP--UDP-N-acetylglucosamine O-acyltransferase [Candidatus Cloacimonadota bacterium]
MENIHSTAIIHTNAKIGKNVKIGPFCKIGEFVEIGDDCVLLSNVVVEGFTKIGKNNKLYHSCIVGSNPQDLKYEGGKTKLVIGNNNTIREFATINTSATMDEKTTIGDNCLLMAYIHVAHNCQLGSNIIMANAVNLAGHVHIHDFVTVGGMTAIHQFVKIGKYAFVGGKSGLKKDIPPFTRGEGMPYKVMGLNSVGLRRKGFTSDDLKGIKVIYNYLYNSGLNVSMAITEALKVENLSNFQKDFINFVLASDRGIAK